MTDNADKAADTGKKPRESVRDSAETIRQFIRSKGEADPQARPKGAPTYSDAAPRSLNVNAGGDHDEIDVEQEIFSMRMWDQEGDDSAYDMGLSPVRKPAPPGGRKPGAKDIFP